MKTDYIVLGGGCFWCLDASYRLIKGVTKVTSGYAGGTQKDPSYLQVAYASTGHAEVVKVEFDLKTISLEDVLDVFWAIHDPTTVNRQGNDVGEQYRSIVLYHDDSQKYVIEKSINKAQKLWDGKIVTEVKKLDKFYEAEEYHQDYFNKNPEQGYCQVIINPKLEKLRKKYTSLLK